MRSRMILVALALSMSACSHSQSATTAAAGTSTPDSAVAQVDTATTQPDAPPDQGPAPTASAGVGSSTGAQCPLLSSAQVEDVLHLDVKSVVLSSDPDSCEFSFTDQLTKLSIDFSPSGGKDEGNSTREGAGGAQAIVGSIIDAAAKGSDSSDAKAAKNLAVGTPPPDLQKIGDDQYAYSVGPLTSYIASKGDAYVNVGISFPPDGVSRWQVVPELARRVLAAH